MAFDVARIRGQFPALGDGWIHLDGTAGMLTPEQVASAVSSAIRTPLAAPGGTFPAARRAEHIADSARKAVADLAGADPAGVVLGPNSVVLLRRLAAVLSQQWRSGDEVVVSRLDEHANTACWQRVARQAGAVVRWGEIDIETCDLPAWQYGNLVTERTRVVSVTAASGSVGTRPDVATVAGFAHRVDALVVVDASHAAGYVPINFDVLDADVIALSGRSWGGPDSGALVFRDPRMLERLPAAALDASSRGPERLGLGPRESRCASRCLTAVAGRSPRGPVGTTLFRIDAAAPHRGDRQCPRTHTGIGIHGAWLSGSSGDRTPGSAWGLHPRGRRHHRA